MKNIDINLDNIRLARGSHSKREQGVCLMEAVAWFAGEKHSDHPKCVDPALAAYGRALNDHLRDDDRQLLKPLIPRLVGTVGSYALMQRRAYLLVDRHMRVNMPAFLRDLPNKPRPDLAERFEALPPMVDGNSADRARDLAREVRADILKDLPDDARADDARADAYAAIAAAAIAAAVAGAARAAAAAAAIAAVTTAGAAAGAAGAAAVAAGDATTAADDAALATRAAALFDAADDAAWRKLRRDTVARAIAAFEEAIALTEKAKA
jgi:hypothetical protein